MWAKRRPATLYSVYMTTTRRSFLGRSLLAGAVPAALVPAFSGQLHAQESHGDGAAAALPAAIAALTDRRAEAKPITSAEREARIARARELMEKNGLAAICIAGGTTLNYF